MDNQVKLIYKLMALSNKVKPFASEIKFAKLIEEVGELAECITKITGYKTNEESKEEILRELWKEIVDIFIMIVSLGIEYEMPLDQFESLTDEKLGKWYHKHIKQYISNPNDVPSEFAIEAFPNGIPRYQENLDKIKESIFKKLQERDQSERKHEIIGDPIQKVREIKPGDLPYPIQLPWMDKDQNSNCLHDTCSECHGTGYKERGGICVHMISCPCKKCSPFSM